MCKPAGNVMVSFNIRYPAFAEPPDKAMAYAAQNSIYRRSQSRQYIDLMRDNNGYGIPVPQSVPVVADDSIKMLLLQYLFQPPVLITYGARYFRELFYDRQGKVLHCVMIKNAVSPEKKKPGFRQFLLQHGSHLSLARYPYLATPSNQFIYNGYTPGSMPKSPVERSH
jgi:hypothetical protein